MVNGERSCFGGAILSGTRLSGSYRIHDKVSNLLDTSREAVVSNNDVEKFGMPHRMHSYAMRCAHGTVIWLAPGAGISLESKNVKWRTNKP